jgi:N-terminal half of MaoC dehydratase
LKLRHAVLATSGLATFGPLTTPVCRSLVASDKYLLFIEAMPKRALVEIDWLWSISHEVTSNRRVTRRALVTGTPQGIFKRETKGLTTTPVNVQLDRSRIVSFAVLLGEMDPVFTDVSAARAMGYPDVPATPSFPAVVERLATAELRQRGALSLTDAVGCDFRYLLHGEQQYAYEGLMYAGDQVSVTSQVLDFYDKRGGLLEFVVFGTTILHADRGVIVRARRTLLHRLG